MPSNEYDLTASLGRGSLRLKIPSDKHPDGEWYTFRSPSGTVGMWLTNLVTLGQQVAAGVELTKEDSDKLAEVDAERQQTIYKQVMGDTMDELLADEVEWDDIQRVFTMLVRKWGANGDMDEMVQALMGEGEAQPNREARRANAKASSRKAGSNSSRASSGTKGRTRSQGSTRSSATSGEAAAKAV